MCCWRCINNLVRHLFIIYNFIMAESREDSDNDGWMTQRSHQAHARNHHPTHIGRTGTTTPIEAVAKFIQGPSHVSEDRCRIAAMGLLPAKSTDDFGRTCPQTIQDFMIFRLSKGFTRRGWSDKSSASPSSILQYATNYPPQQPSSSTRRCLIHPSLSVL